MQVTLSERKLCERIRELEGIQDTVEEISDRMAHFAGRLFGEIAKYGVQMQGLIRQNGGLGTFQFALDPIFSPDDRQTRFSGLAMMNPNSLTVTFTDLPGLFERGIVLTAMYDGWNTYCDELQGLSVAELGPALERIAGKIVFGPMVGGAELLDPESREEYFQTQLKRAGLKDPSAKRREIDEYNRAEIARVEAEREAAYNKFRNGDED